MEVSDKEHYVLSILEWLNGTLWLMGGGRGAEELPLIYVASAGCGLALLQKGEK